MKLYILLLAVSVDSFVPSLTFQQSRSGSTNLNAKLLENNQDVANAIGKSVPIMIASHFNHGPQVGNY